MGKLNQIAVVFVGVVVLVTFLAGCEADQQTDGRKTRLLADENRRLSRELAECNKQLEGEPGWFGELGQGQAGTAAKPENMTEALLGIMREIGRENTALTKENESLKEEIKKLRETVPH